MVMYLGVLTSTLLLYPLLRKKWYFLCVFLIMIINVGTRDEHMGTDTSNYQRLYSTYAVNPDLSLEPSFIEVGNRYLIYTASCIYDDSSTFFCLAASITFFLVGMTVYKNTKAKGYWLPVFLLVGLGFYSYTFNALRQAIAVAFIFMLTNYIRSQRIFPIAILIFLASLFHYSALFMICMVALFIIIKRHIKHGYSPIKLYLLYNLSIGIITLWGYKAVIRSVDFLSKYEYYLDNVTTEANAVELHWARIALASMYFLISVCLVWLSKIDKTCGASYLTMGMMMSLAAMFTFAQQTTAYIFYRIVDYFAIFAVLAVPMVIERIRPEIWRLPLKIAVIIMGYLSAIHIVSSGINGLQ